MLLLSTQQDAYYFWKKDNIVSQKFYFNLKSLSCFQRSKKKIKTVVFIKMEISENRVLKQKY